MSVSQATPVVAGTLAVYNNGAALTKVTNKATLSFSGAKTVATAGYLGGLVGLANVGSVYTDCHNTGEFIITGTARTEFIGGIVAGTADKTEGSLVNCTNKGNFSFDFPGAVDTGQYGGLFGHAEKSNWTFSNCTNEGTFTVTFADPGTSSTRWAVSWPPATAYSTIASTRARSCSTTPTARNIAARAVS